jgi:hypothetical protein
VPDLGVARRLRLGRGFGFRFTGRVDQRLSCFVGCRRHSLAERLDQRLACFIGRRRHPLAERLNQWLACFVGCRRHSLAERLDQRLACFVGRRHSLALRQRLASRLA